MDLVIGVPEEDFEPNAESDAGMFHAIASRVAFAESFESIDTSAWSAVVP